MIFFYDKFLKQLEILSDKKFSFSYLKWTKMTKHIKALKLY